MMFLPLSGASCPPHSHIPIRLREMPVTRDCLLIAMTGWSTDEAAARARAAGFDKHLVKPISVDALTNALGAGVR